MVLAKDEQVLKAWEYASSKVKTVETKYSLTVTNKRIISRSKSSRKSACEEIPISAVKGISVVHEVASKFWAILLITLGVLFISVTLFLSLSAILKGDRESFDPARFFIGLVLGVFLIYLGGIRLRNLGGMFTLIISTKGVEGQPMKIGVIKLLKNFFNFRGKMKIKINHQVAENISDTLGALIIS